MTLNTPFTIDLDPGDFCWSPTGLVEVVDPVTSDTGYIRCKRAPEIWGPDPFGMESGAPIGSEQGLNRRALFYLHPAEVPKPGQTWHGLPHQQVLHLHMDVSREYDQVHGDRPRWTMLVHVFDYEKMTSLWFRFQEILPKPIPSKWNGQEYYWAWWIEPRFRPQTGHFDDDLVPAT